MTRADSMYLMYIVSLYLYFIVHMILYIMCLTLRCVNMCIIYIYIYISFYTKCKRIHCIQHEKKDVNSYPCSFLKPALPVVKSSGFCILPAWKELPRSSKPTAFRSKTRSFEDHRGLGMGENQPLSD